MTIAAVICTGQSVTQADVDLLRGKCKVVVVSDAYKLAPWADAMVSQDLKWWRAHPECDFAGPRFCGYFQDLPQYNAKRLWRAGLASGGNSGCLGLIAADELFKPSKILLLGADLHGTHYFGKHTRADLTNTDDNKFARMIRQYSNFRKLPIVNCSMISKLPYWPKMTVKDALSEQD